MAPGSKAILWCAWPGLRQLWLRGSWPALVLAVGLSGLLNLLLVSSLVWTEWFSPAARWAGWAVLLGTWGVAGVGTCSAVAYEERTHVRARGSGTTEGQDPLALAMDEYLQGKWYETESILKRMLRQNRRDVEARLMLATLCRHTQRLDEARRHLAELTAWESAAQWQTEIEIERQLLDGRRRATRPKAKGEQSVEVDKEGSSDTPDMTRAA